MKKILYKLVIFIFLLFVFKGIIFRALINYQSVGQREFRSLDNEKLINLINTELKNKKLSIDDAIEYTLSKTNFYLKFSFIQNSNSPNQLIISGKANCIGYSTLFNSILSHIISKQKNLQNYQSNHEIGKLSLLGFNLHKLFSNNFFKDHDFNKVINTNTGEEILVDPSLNDYFGINRVK